MLSMCIGEFTVVMDLAGSMIFKKIIKHFSYSASEVWGLSFEVMFEGSKKWVLFVFFLQSWYVVTNFGYKICNHISIL